MNRTITPDTPAAAALAPLLTGTRQLRDLWPLREPVPTAVLAARLTTLYGGSAETGVLSAHEPVAETHPEPPGRD